MKQIYPIMLLILILIFCTGFSDASMNIAISYQPNVDMLEDLFRSKLPLKDGIVYTKVPRGLIISMDEKIFFNEGDARIKESSLYILDILILMLSELSNYCVVEDHTRYNDFTGKIYKENWELSMVRSANIIDYMILCGKLSANQLFSTGFGEFMPFRDNVSKTGVYGNNYSETQNVSGGVRNIDLNERVDFVILEYEAKR